MSSARANVCLLLLRSELFRHWHWFRYHFSNLNVPGWEHPLAESVIDAVVDCDRVMPGYAQLFITRLAGIGGKEKFEPHYEQLLQCLAELHVVRQIATYPWPGGAQFRSEPTAEGSLKNPEIIVEHAGISFGIEVKSPALLQHVRNRGQNPTQVPARVFGADALSQLQGSDKALTKPRDNPIKDFLVSANAKFLQFKALNTKFVGVLVIVWDDHIYEPISSLLHNSSGLLTEKSFYVDEHGSPIRFPHVDGIVILRHLHQLIRATRDKPLIDACQHPLDYGAEGVFPFKAFIENPWGQPVPEIMRRCLQAQPPTAEMGAEYTPKDLVWWFPG